MLCADPQIPIFTETIVDDSFNTSPQTEVAVRLIHDLCSTYSIDTDRLYTTGQSMGGMTSFRLNVAYSDLFAAWPVSWACCGSRPYRKT